MNTRGLRGESGHALTFHKKLTEQFRHIAGDSKVQVGWNGRYQMWNLLWRGKFIMSMNSADGYNKERVRKHFKKLRSNGYDNVKRDMAKAIERENAHGRYLEQQQEEEAREIGMDILVKQKESIFVNGG